MRTITRMIGLSLLLLVAGCESTRFHWLKREPAQELPPIPKQPANNNNVDPAITAIVKYLNDNARRIHSVTSEMGIDTTIENRTFGLRGRIYAEKPHKFRMKATAFAKDRVDIGSNPHEFWFWAADNPDPKQYLYFCTYKDLNEGRAQMMPLPIQPEWVMETMGLGPYGPESRYQFAEDAQTFRLIEHVKSPTGHPVRKVMLINRNPTQAPTPQVLAYLLQHEGSGQEICSAHIIETKVDRATGAILPYKMELRMPSQRMKLALKMDNLIVNSTIAPTVFVRPQMHGVEPFNLATGRPERLDLQRTQGVGQK